MIEVNSLLEKMSVVSHDNTLYLLENLPYGTGLFAYNGDVLYVVPNLEECMSLSIKTEFLCVETNIYVSAFNPSVSSFKNGYYNYVELQLSTLTDLDANLNAFVNLCLAHATYTHGEDFMTFFDSLVSLFQLPREQQYKNLIGFMGELFFIKYVYSNLDEDLSPYWHADGVNSRLDFSLPFANIEVKTTNGDSSSFVIKHDQLFVNSDRNILVAIAIEENGSGLTLEDLVREMLEDSRFCNNMSFCVNIEKEKRRISPSEMNTRRFVLKKISAYRAADINPFTSIPDYVADLSYKLNLLPFSSLSLEELFSQKH